VESLLSLSFLEDEGLSDSYLFGDEEDSAPSKVVLSLSSNIAHTLILHVSSFRIPQLN